MSDAAGMAFHVQPSPAGGFNVMLRGADKSPCRTTTLSVADLAAGGRGRVARAPRDAS